MGARRNFRMGASNIRTTPPHGNKGHPKEEKVTKRHLHRKRGHSSGEKS